MRLYLLTDPKGATQLKSVCLWETKRGFLESGYSVVGNATWLKILATFRVVSMQSRCTAVTLIMAKPLRCQNYLESQLTSFEDGA